MKEEKKYEIAVMDTNMDMHNHTRGSDGRQSSLRFLLRASNKGRNIVSITDHDSIQGYENLKDDLYAVVETVKMDKSYDPTNIIDILEEIKILEGTELITSYNGIIIEVLGYGFDIQKMGEEIKQLKQTVQRKPYEVLYESFKKKIEEKGLAFDKQILEDAYQKIKIEGKGGVVGPFFNELYSHEENRKYLEYEEKGEIKTADTLKLFINKHLYRKGSELFVDMSPTRPNYQDTIDVIHNSGGKAVLAHPGRYMDKWNVLETLDDMISYGLEGIEVFYPDHEDNFKEELLEKVKKHHLIATGGSDDHHSKKEGIQYDTGKISVPVIPETEWIKKQIEKKDGYIQKNNLLQEYIGELKQIKEERDRKREVEEEER